MSNNEAWTEKYRPETTDECQGNNKDIRELKQWVDNFSVGDQPQLLVGPPGVGKSSAIQAIANEKDIPLLEINASDARRTDEINAFVRNAHSAPFDADKQIVMFDEVDSLSGRSNFTMLYKMLDHAPNPIVFIANEKWEIPNGIKDRCETRKFSLGTRSIKAKLKKIIKKEDLDIGASTLTRLSQRESLRDAINDLQSIADGQDLRPDERQYESSIFDEVDKVIKGEQANFSETPDEALLWVDQNIRTRYRLTEAMMAWECMSRSDKWLGRVNGSDYSWWKYAGALNDQVPNLRLSDAYDGYISKERPEKMKRGWGRGVEGDVYEKLSGADDSTFRMGANFYEFKEKYIPLLQESDKETKMKIAREHDLSDKEMKLLDINPSEYEEWKEGGDIESAQQYQEEKGSVNSFMEW